MKPTTLALLITACMVSPFSWAADAAIVLPAQQNPVSQLPVPKLDVAEAFEAADVNDDQRVTYEEARAYFGIVLTREIFDQYDTNLDGYLDRAEAGLPPADVQLAQLFDVADANNDGKLTFEEVYAANNLVTREQFDTWDTNLDGYVTREEAGLPPKESTGCAGCSGNKMWPSGGDLFSMALSLLGLAVMAKTGRGKS